MATRDVELGAGDSIEHTVQFLLDCKEKGRDLGNQHPPSIFRVPSVYRVLSPKSYNPRVVSIGPLHRHDKILQEFEIQKTYYLHRLLELSGSNPEETIRECVQKVSGKIEQVKACYAESLIYNDVDLARMMVIDAYFILYFIQLIRCEEDGPFLGNSLTASDIVYDLMLIENQIPLFVLQDIFESTILQFAPMTPIIDFMQILLTSYNIFGDDIICRKVSLDTTHAHILGLLHKSLQPAYEIPSSENYISPKRHSAVELDRAGVNFRPYHDENWVMAMKVELIPRFSLFPWFWRKPTLTMPILNIGDSTEWVLRNLIIYEQSTQVPNYVTTYMWAMGMLIHTPHDVAILGKSGVLSTISSDQNAFNIIYNICKEVVYNDFVYHQEGQQLDFYYNSYWPNAVAGLKRTYFSSPWNMIALFAGIVLFVLTVVQTIYTIKDANPIKELQKLGFLL